MRKAADADCAVYAWVIDGEIVRIGCCKSTLRRRIEGSAGWKERRLRGETRVRDQRRIEKELADAKRWLDRLGKGGKHADVWGRSGATVMTPVGEINTYLSEENALLSWFKPPFNNSHYR